MNNNSTASTVATDKQSDGVQMTGSGSNPGSDTKTTEEWVELEKEHIARTGGLGNHFNKFVAGLEVKALKEAEGRELSGDTDSEGEDLKNLPDDNEIEDSDDESEPEDKQDKNTARKKGAMGTQDAVQNNSKKKVLTQKEKQAIWKTAARPSNRLGPAPGSVLDQEYVTDSESDDDDFDSVQSSDDDEMEEENELEYGDEEDDEMMDVK